MASGVDSALLDRVVAASTREAKTSYRIPEAARIARDALAEVDTMLAPLRAAGSAAAAGLDERMAKIAAALTAEGDLIEAVDIARLTQAGERHADSLHLVVMEAHRELNALATRLATETIDGAHVHGLEHGDRPLVAAFMRGLHETDCLRFEHPGLGTTATRVGDALVVQNDLGETDAHVVVVRIVGRSATITYTDVHLERLVFFQRLFAAWGVSWEDTRSRSDQSMEDGLFHLALGRLEADDDASLEKLLRFLGSRLVFMIDWNRARKRLRSLVGKRGAIELLAWAADHGHGHRAFLIAGGDRLVYDALEFAGGRAGRPGDNLRDTLGAAGARDYLRGVLRICSEGMLADRPVSLVQDEVRAELIGYLQGARAQLLELVVRHGELVVEIAETTRDALEQAAGQGGADRAVAPARRARAWERQADELVGELRAAAQRVDEAGSLLGLVEAADDIADSLEEAAFYLTLLPPGRPSEPVAREVRRMCALVVASARLHLRALLLAGEVQRGGPREELDAFLEAVHGVISLERDADDAQRDVHAAIVGEGPEATELFVLVEATRGLEEAADALMHSALQLRDQVLGSVVRAETPRRLGAAAPRPPVTVSLSDDLYVVGDRQRPFPDARTIGAKAHGLARMAQAGLRVPEAVVLTTAVARRFLAGGDVEGLSDLLDRAAGALDAQTGRRLGSRRRPLLVSVRSGAPVSMPGMLETVLDVGLSDLTVRAVVAQTGNPRLAWDSYRRLVESFAGVVHGCPLEPFEGAVRQRLTAAGAGRPLELEARTLEELTREHLDRFAELTGAPFPEDPLVQLEQAVLAVLRSWDAPKAREYRRQSGVPDDLGTAVIVQRMVFGNAGGRSGSGVGFTRDPALGERRLYLDFLLDAQGEDVVSGRHRAHGAEELAAVAPDLYEAIAHVCPLLEREFGDAQEFELTVEDGDLFLLQTRTAKRTPWAALRIAVDQVAEGLISAQAVLARLAAVDLDSIRRVRVGGADEHAALARAIPASVGVACGPIALDAEAAARFAREGRPPVLVRPDTATEDIAAMIVSAGILTGTGGRTSHAAVVARELGKPCLVGCSNLTLDPAARTVTLGSSRLVEGDILTLDAESGLVFAGEPEVVEERPLAELETVAAWRTGAQGRREVAHAEG